MKTYTKKTEEQYLEYLNGYTQVLKQEYADRILAELKEQDLICECVRGETKETGNYYHSTRYTEYLYDGKVAMEVYEGSMSPSIKLEGKILLVEGNLYCNADRMSNLIEIELSFGRLIIGGYHRIFVLLKTDELLQFDNFWTVNTTRNISGSETFQPYKHTSEEITQIANTINKPFSDVVFLYRNKEIALNHNEEVRENRIETDGNISTIILPTLSGSVIKIDVPNSGLFTFYINNVRATKKSIMDSGEVVYMGFEIQSLNNRLEHFRDVLENPMKYAELLNIQSPFVPIKTFVNMLYSDKLETWFQVYPNVQAFQNVSWEYLIKYYDLFDKDSLVRDLKANFFNTLPKRDVIYTLSLKALTGIRLMNIMDSGVGIYNIIKYFSTEQLETIGCLWVDVCGLKHMASAYSKMEFLYKPEIERYTDILDSIDSVKDFTNLLNITTSYNQIVSELESAKNILNYHIFGNEELSPLALHERLKNINSYYINDTIKMFKVINRDKTLKDFYNTLKTTTMEELHNKYQLVYQAITNAKIEQEYQEVISQLNVQEYDNGEFSITIPKTTQDIINEGKALHHCVGVYVDKVIRREDMIYFLRKDREVPYVTIEVKDKKVTQVEGDMNNRFISKGSPEYEAIKEWAALNKFGIL
mgnify:CR=1 FL=1|jgi:hypothetical protein